jgi:GTP-binding protein
VSGFVDEAQVHARAGDGGAGCVSFRREAHVDRGGPDGGDGGRGGDVWLVADTNQASLLGFRDHPHRRAVDGGHGSSKRKHGARGPDLDAPVPVGTIVRDRDGTVLCDLAGAGDRWLAGQGGRGGRGNARFLSNTRRAPSFAEQGERGEERWLDLELRLMADVALVGFPNVGKSTLISVVSAAHPKIADYPFTTLEPHLGVVRVGGRAGRAGDEMEFVMADIPGLVEGAAEGRGLGHRFLRHVERASVLLVLVDLGAPDGTTPAAQLAVLEHELGSYRPELLERPRLVVGSRADLADGPDAGIELDARIAAVTGDGIPALLHAVSALVVEARSAAAAPAGEIVVHRPAPEGISVERQGPGAWRVTGREAVRAVGFSDLTDEGAMAEALRRLRRLGVDRALSRAGARDGDQVEVGTTSFTWYRDGREASLDASEDPDGPRRRARR